MYKNPDSVKLKNEKTQQTRMRCVCLVKGTNKKTNNKKINKKIDAYEKISTRRFVIFSTRTKQKDEPFDSVTNYKNC